MLFKKALKLKKKQPKPFDFNDGIMHFDEIEEGGEVRN